MGSELPERYDVQKTLEGYLRDVQELMFLFCLGRKVFFLFCIGLFFSSPNQQSEFTFYKLMLWLLQCHDEKSSSGESSVPQIRSIGRFLWSRLFSSLTSSVLRGGFTCVTSVVWCLLHFWWMTSCTYAMPRSACSWVRKMSPLSTSLCSLMPCIELVIATVMILAYNFLDRT
jgi:hypothetical protein